MVPQPQRPVELVRFHDHGLDREPGAELDFIGRRQRRRLREREEDFAAPAQERQRPILPNQAAVNQIALDPLRINGVEVKQGRAKRRGGGRRRLTRPLFRVDPGGGQHRPLPRQVPPSVQFTGAVTPSGLRV